MRIAGSIVRSILPCLAILGLSVGCHYQAPAAKVNFAQPLPEGMLALHKIPPSQYPDFGAQPIDVRRLEMSIDNSLKYLAAPSGARFFPYLDIDHDRAVASLRHLREVCEEIAASGRWDSAWINQKIRSDFEVYQSIGAQNPDRSGYTGRVLFTAYCTPTLDASLQQTSEFRWPLYKLPPDLVRNAATGDVQGRKTADGRIVPYYTRGEIENGKLPGDELVWLRSRWDAYVITVQGSARLRLTDTGKIYEVGFAGTNGYPYTSPGRQMVADGVITADQLNLKSLGNYFTAHPEMMDKYLSLNQRFIFFTERPGGPFGSLNVPVTGMATIATDKDVYPRAMPAFVNIPTASAGAGPIQSFMLDQDAGGAIRASGRCDIYMGVGPEAQALAGQELQEGTLYYLAIKPELMNAIPKSALMP